jgi:hypothetical protein
MSWSSKPALLPFYSGILTDLPNVNKKQVYALLCSICLW